MFHVVLLLVVSSDFASVKKTYMKREMRRGGNGKSSLEMAFWKYGMICDNVVCMHSFWRFFFIFNFFFFFFY